MLISLELMGDGLLYAGGCALMYPKHSHIFLKGGGSGRERKPGGRRERVAEMLSFPCLSFLSAWLNRGNWTRCIFSGSAL